MDCVLFVFMMLKCFGTKYETSGSVILTVCYKFSDRSYEWKSRMLDKPVITCWQLKNHSSFHCIVRVNQSIYSPTSKTQTRKHLSQRTYNIQCWLGAKEKCPNMHRHCQYSNSIILTKTYIISIIFIYHTRTGHKIQKLNSVR